MTKKLNEREILRGNVHLTVKLSDTCTLHPKLLKWLIALSKYKNLALYTHFVLTIKM